MTGLAALRRPGRARLVPALRHGLVALIALAFLGSGLAGAVPVDPARFQAGSDRAGAAPARHVVIAGIAVALCDTGPAGHTMPGHPSGQDCTHCLCVSALADLAPPAMPARSEAARLAPPGMPTPEAVRLAATRSPRQAQAPPALV